MLPLHCKSLAALHSGPNSPPPELSHRKSHCNCVPHTALSPSGSLTNGRVSVPASYRLIFITDSYLIVQPRSSIQQFPSLPRSSPSFLHQCLSLLHHYSSLLHQYPSLLHQQPLPQQLTADLGVGHMAIITHLGVQYMAVITHLGAQARTFTIWPLMLLQTVWLSSLCTSEE